VVDACPFPCSFSHAGPVSYRIDSALRIFDGMAMQKTCGNIQRACLSQKTSPWTAPVTCRALYRHARHMQNYILLLVARQEKHVQKDMMQHHT